MSDQLERSVALERNVSAAELQPETIHGAAYVSMMTKEGNELRAVGAKDLVEESRGATHVVLKGLFFVGLPPRVGLCKPRFKVEEGKHGCDIGLAGSLVARVLSV